MYPDPSAVAVAVGPQKIRRPDAVLFFVASIDNPNPNLKKYFQDIVNEGLNPIVIYFIIIFSVLLGFYLLSLDSLIKKN